MFTSNSAPGLCCLEQLSYLGALQHRALGSCAALLAETCCVVREAEFGGKGILCCLQVQLSVSETSLQKSCSSHDISITLVIQPFAQSHCSISVLHYHLNRKYVVRFVLCGPYK